MAILINVITFATIIKQKKPMMRKKERMPLLLLALAAMLPMRLSAQVNPKAGFILTNDNDTVRGTIDYRMDKRNAQECLFRAEGAQQFVAYKPDDIKGYRLTDNGAFYVTRTFAVNGVEQTFFAEYLLKGGVSLYYYAADDGNNYYIFEGEEGKTGLMRERNFQDYDSEEVRDLRRNDMNSVSQVFIKSHETVERLWKTGYNRKELTNITRRYSEQYCTDAGDCVQFEYDQHKTAAFAARLYLGLGFKAGSVKPKYFKHGSNSSLSFSAFMPHLSVGCDVLLPRMSQHFMLQALLDLGYMDVSKGQYRLKGCTLETQWGVAYRFLSDRKVSPLVRGGVSFNHLLGSSHENMQDISGGNRHNMDIDFGFYLGAGADVNIGRQLLRLTVNYEYSSSLGMLDIMANENLCTSAVSVGAGVVF